MIPRYFPFNGDDSRPQLGLKPLSIEDWIEVDENWERHLDLKASLLVEHRDTVLGFLPEATESVFELRRVLARHLSERFPDRYAYHDDVMKARGEDFPRPVDGSMALEQISRWTQEDWAVLSATAPVKLEAGCVCFPSRWSLAEKIGRAPDAIHAPVPRYATTIARPTQGFLERITAEKPMWRLNWTIHDSDRLFCPGPHPPAKGITRENVIDRTWLRIERQTLRRLPETGGVAFSIRTYVDPLRDVIAEPGRRRLLAETIRNLPDDTAEYKGMKAFHALLKDALSEAPTPAQRDIGGFSEAPSPEL